jgi:hypothetical protein
MTYTQKRKFTEIDLDALALVKAVILKDEAGAQAVANNCTDKDALVASLSGLAAVFALRAYRDKAGALDLLDNMREVVKEIPGVLNA